MSSVRPLEDLVRDVGKPHLLPDAVRTFDEAQVVALPPRRFSQPYAPVALELARVSIPKDAVGVVVGLWQWLASPVASMVHGPWAYRALGAQVLVRWSLVLEDKAPDDRALRRIEGAEAEPPRGRLPPYGALEDLRFPWGHELAIKVFAPERSTVSLWARVVAPGGELRQVGGRLWGYTQHGKSPAAYQNLARGQ